MTDDQRGQRPEAAYMVVAYRTRRAYALDHRDYSERAATHEEAERARQRLAEEARRNRIGWRYIDIRPAAASGPGSSR